MTLEELGSRLKAETPGKYEDWPARELALAIIAEKPQYLRLIDDVDIPGPANMKGVYALRAVASQPSGTLLDWLKVDGAKDQTELLSERRKSVEHMAAMQVVATATAFGVSPATYEQMQLMAHQTNEQLRAAAVYAAIAVKQKEDELRLELNHRREEADLTLKYTRDLHLLEEELNGKAPERTGRHDVSASEREELVINEVMHAISRLQKRGWNKKFYMYIDEAGDYPRLGVRPRTTEDPTSRFHLPSHQ